MGVACYFKDFQDGWLSCWGNLILLRPASAKARSISTCTMAEDYDELELKRLRENALKSRPKPHHHVRGVGSNLQKNIFPFCNELHFVCNHFG